VFTEDILFAPPKFLEDKAHWEPLKQSELYSHAYHANERDKQWQMCEPAIPKGHMDQIFHAAAVLFPPPTELDPHPETPPDERWGQAEVRRILRHISKDFVKKYLEKWRTIVEELTGIRRKIPPDELVQALHRDFVKLCVPMLEYTRKEVAPSGKPKHNLRPLDSIYLVLLHKHGKLAQWKHDFYMIKSPKKYKEFMSCMEYSFNWVAERTTDPAEKLTWAWTPLDQSMFPLKPTFSRKDKGRSGSGSKATYISPNEHSAPIFISPTPSLSFDLQDE
jgi:hypothetical protein